MKKRVISLLAAAMLLLVCAGPVWADTDKDIQFTGFVFGETFAEASQEIWINSVEFERKPRTARATADPVYSDARNRLYDDSQVGYCFRCSIDGQDTAGHYAGRALYFHFATPEAANAREIDTAVLYGGVYEFYDDNKKAVFDDLKQKLTSVYGSPSAEFTAPEEFWGKPAHREGMEDEEAERIYQEELERYKEISFVVWQQSGADKQLVLVYFCNQDNWENTRLYYLDTSADALIMQMYPHQSGQGGASTFSDSTQGL